MVEPPYGCQNVFITDFRRVEELHFISYSLREAHGGVSYGEDSIGGVGKWT